VAVSGLVIVDKPGGMTSHDVVARVRRLAGTRRVGHAGTLDPMATGVLILGVERATKLLGHLALHDKAYDATIRLGVTTVTDDAEGDVIDAADTSAITEDDLRAAVRALTGDLLQVPSSVSAIKVDGKRSYARVRAGEAVDLPARAVRIEAFDIGSIRSEGGLLEIDAHIECTTGTYVRALARDLGVALEVGGHLTALRRTRVGVFSLADAFTLDELGEQFASIALDDAVARCFPRRDLTADEAVEVSHGRRLPSSGEAGATGVFSPDGTAIALMSPVDGTLRPLVVFAPA
jgi:tRNA pseudouridine55 synthase